MKFQPNGKELELFKVYFKPMLPVSVNQNRHEKLDSLVFLPLFLPLSLSCAPLP